MTLTVFVGLLLCSVLLEAFFAGSEMALISADRLELHKRALSGSSGAKLALKLVAKPEQVLATTMVGTSLCIVFEATATTLFVFSTLGPEYDFWAVLIISPFILIFGEIIPKTIFQRYAEVLAPRIAGLVNLARLVLFPITWVLDKYSGWLSKLIRPIEEAITGKHQPSHREELRYLLTYGQKETTLKSSERRMIRKILDFSRAEVKRAVLPLVKVDMIEDSCTAAEALEAFNRFGHSRLPVYHERVDNIVGILHVYDLFLESGTENDSRKLVTEIMRPAFYAPEVQQLEKLFFTMQKKAIQMAIVVDEYGGAVGILTVEDVLEEIVGEIKDEYDSDTALYREISDREYLIQGQMEITAINEALKLNIPKGDYETLAGFLLQQFNRIPEEGDELYFGELKFTIRKASNRVIQMVQIGSIQ